MLTKQRAARPASRRRGHRRRPRSPARRCRPRRPPRRSPAATYQLAVGAERQVHRRGRRRRPTTARCCSSGACTAGATWQQFERRRRRRRATTWSTSTAARCVDVPSWLHHLRPAAAAVGLRRRHQDQPAVDVHRVIGAAGKYRDQSASPAGCASATRTAPPPAATRSSRRPAPTSPTCSGPSTRSAPPRPRTGGRPHLVEHGGRLRGRHHRRRGRHHGHRHQPGRPGPVRRGQRAVRDPGQRAPSPSRPYGHRDPGGVEQDDHRRRHATARSSHGGFFLGAGTRNVIIRNLTIRDTLMADDDPDDKTYDYDGIQMDTADHIWIDHNTITRMNDGLIDSRMDTTNLTVSWNVLGDSNKAFGIGWTDERHRPDDDPPQLDPRHQPAQPQHRQRRLRPPVQQLPAEHHLVRQLRRAARRRWCWRTATSRTSTTRTTPTRDRAAARRAAASWSTAPGQQQTNGSAFTPSSFYSYTLDPAANVPGAAAHLRRPAGQHRRLAAGANCSRRVVPPAGSCWPTMTDVLLDA